MDCSLRHILPGRIRLRIESREAFREYRNGLEAFMRQVPGVQDVRLSASSQCVILKYDPAEINPSNLIQIIENELTETTLQECQNQIGPSEIKQKKKLPYTHLGLSSAAAALAALGEGFVAPWLLVSAAAPIFKRAVDAIFHQRKLTIDTLDASAAMLLMTQGKFFTGSIMVWLISLGDFLRDYTQKHSVETVQGLYSREGVYAWVMRGDQRHKVKADELAVGDKVVVYPGEMVAVDGEVFDGEGMVDQKTLTGESLPVHKAVGDKAFAGTFVTEGKLYLKTEKTGAQTKVSEMVQMILSTPVSDTRAQNYAEAFANKVVPWSFAAAGSAVITARGVDAAASLLIVDFGTGIRVAAPTAVLASITRAARQSIHIKAGKYLERLAEVDTVVFDKTGTLTTGIAEIVDVIPFGVASEEEVLAVAASAEARFKHPTAEAIVRAAIARGISIHDRESSDYTIGQGVEAIVRGMHVLVGRSAFLKSKGVALRQAAEAVLDAEAQGDSSLYVAVDGQLVGLLVYSDPLRPEAPEVVEALRQRGVRELVILTGDNQAVASVIAQKVGISSFIADVFPDQKAELVKALQQEGHVVALVGDGVNDSLALTCADVGIAVHNGSEIARETAHVALHDESLWKIPVAFDLARENRKLIRQNWQMNLYPNGAAIGLALLGIVGPVGATIISNGAAVFATLNALRPLMQNPNANADEIEQAAAQGQPLEVVSDKVA